MHLGILGMGSVGGAAYHALNYYHDEVKGYDIDPDRSENEFEELMDCDALLICVPTELDEETGRLDMQIVEDTLGKLIHYEYEGLVVVKSTVSLGFFEELFNNKKLLVPVGGGYNKLTDFKERDFRIAYAPEFLRERSAYQFFVNPDRLVFTVEPEMKKFSENEMVPVKTERVEKDERLLKEIFNWCDCPIFWMTFREAELMKLAHNMKIAMDVSFANEMKMICKEQGANATRVMKSIWADKRRTPYWLNPEKGSYSDSMCIPKDSQDIMNATDSEFFKGAKKVNDRFDEEKLKKDEIELENKE